MPSICQAILYIMSNLQNNLNIIKASIIKEKNKAWNG